VVSRQAAEDRGAELLAWLGKPVTDNEYAFGEPKLPHVQEQQKSFKIRTLLLRGGGSGRGMGDAGSSYASGWVLADGEVQKASIAMSQVGNLERAQRTAPCLWPKREGFDYDLQALW